MSLLDFWKVIQENREQHRKLPRQEENPIQEHQADLDSLGLHDLCIIWNAHQNHLHLREAFISRRIFLISTDPSLWFTQVLLPQSFLWVSDAVSSQKSQHKRLNEQQGASIRTLVKLEESPITTHCCSSYQNSWWYTRDTLQCRKGNLSAENNSTLLKCMDK